MSTNKNKQKASASSPQNTTKAPTAKKPSPFSFSNTECKLEYDAYVSNREVPKTDLHNSLFFDLRNLPVSEEVLFEALKDQINGIAFRQETNFLEITLKDPVATKTLLAEGILLNNKPVIPLPLKTWPQEHLGSNLLTSHFISPGKS
jgi:hypothetical protein